MRPRSSLGMRPRGSSGTRPVCLLWCIMTSSEFFFSTAISGYANTTVHYSGTPLLWTPCGPSKVSCIERCPHFRGKFLLRKYIWDIVKCPQYRGVLISGVSFKRGSTVICTSPPHSCNYRSTYDYLAHPYKLQVTMATECIL